MIAASGWRRFPPRLDWQPIFYPVLTADYATRIAGEWNTRGGGLGYVPQFEVDADHPTSRATERQPDRERLTIPFHDRANPSRNPPAARGSTFKPA